MMEISNKVLVLAPHTDDGELGCGGTIARMLEEGKDIYYVAFSVCKESVPAGLPEDTLKNELDTAMKMLGVKKENVIVLDFPVREFPSNRQLILDSMITIDKKIEADLVFSPSVHDIHQDHRVIAEEAMRAFKKKTLFAYEVPWNHFTFNNQIYIRLEKKHIQKKIDAISCYKSQASRNYTDEKFTWGQARVHGVQIGQKYAEVFEAVRYVY